MLRLVLFFGALPLATLAALGRAPIVNYGLAALGLLGFFFLVRVQDVWETALSRMRARLTLYKREKAVRAFDWDGLKPLPETAEENLPWYFQDLDVLGDRSLLRLINLSVSNQGWRKLIQIFASNDVSDSEIDRRSRLVSELTRARLLRKRFFVFTQASASAIDSESIRRSLDHAFAKTGARGLFWFMAAIQTVALVLFAQGNRVFWIPGAIVCVGHLLARKRAHTLHAYEHAMSIALSLDRFRQAVAPLERWSLQQSQLKMSRFPELLVLLGSYGGVNSASLQLKRLDRLSGVLGVRQNFVAHLLVHLVFPWDLFWTLRLEKLREQLVKLLPEWQGALAEFEALASVAEYASLQKDWRPARLLKPSDSVYLDGLDIRHPLISSDKAVGNDLRMSEDMRCLLITGSNMSGKTTFLRAVGMNLILAKAGSPVACQEFRFANQPLFTALRVNDSLQDGLSSFYAEVKRLQSILEYAQKGKRCFYLLDEIFRGTNNRERFIGSRSYLKAMAQTPAFGMVTTHDLELAALEGSAPALKNFHFREEILGDRMSFSYKKLSGPSTSTNALKVMELNGLPID